jgi:isoleucyl-tRNA synthetase
MAAEQKKTGYKETLNLPKTDFPIRANAKENDPKMLMRWQEEDLYAQAMQCHEGAQKYILHDGPPYANGNIHLGHAYNKILKDIVTKSRRMMGYHVPVVPGWDCHGLPIEQKVTQQNPELTGPALKQACRDYAMRWVDVQREEFKAIGVVMDWEHPYITMSHNYEASTLEAFADLVDSGYVERKNKTVTWCPTCETVLASAEIEYKERKDPSIFVRFALTEAERARIIPDIDGPVSFAVWTTTPWTIPLNRAVLLRPNASYQLVALNGHNVILAAPRVADLAHALDAEPDVLKTLSAEDLVGASVQHPIVDELTVPVLADASVGLDEGTGVVHSAPGVGPIDYEIGVKNNLAIYSPISPSGTYTDDIVPEELAGMKVTEAHGWVIKTLQSSGHLLHKKSLRHSYPHCWRCGNGLIFRATPQWFILIDKHDTKQKALQAIESMQFSPEQGRNFLRATVEHRWEWCISRQRAWGVPIPALLSSDASFITGDFIRNVAAYVKEAGIEAWDQITLDQLQADGVIPSDMDVSQYQKETDILDVWFDAGVSHYAVLAKRPSLGVPADLYAEGVDQHRGWFQSSLLTGIALQGQAPMRGIMTHGFTVDENGQKMSKSRGNVVSPHDIIDRIGTDGLRLWVASIGNDGDAIVSDALLNNVSQVYRKIRNTARFLLQNLYDYDHERDGISLTEMYVIDQHALQVLYQHNQHIINNYLQGNMTAVFHTLGDYCATELSSFYLDIIKDRLYCEKADGHKRRSAQTAMWHILDTLIRLMAPIASFTAEQLSDYHETHHEQQKDASIHLQRFATLRQVWNDLFSDGASVPVQAKGHWYGPADVNAIYTNGYYTEELPGKAWWESLADMRSAVLKVIEEQRASGAIKHSLEAHVTLYCDEQMHGYDVFQALCTHMKQRGQDIDAFLKELFIVSQVTIAPEKGQMSESLHPGLFVHVEHAHGEKCPRCWHWDQAVAEHDVCTRCCNVIAE